MTENELATLREELENASGDLRELCEEVAVPMQSKQYLAYFCGANAESAAQNAPRRHAFYAAIERHAQAHLALAQSAPGQDLVAAGYSPREIASIEKETTRFSQLRQQIRAAAGEEI